MKKPKSDLDIRENNSPLETIFQLKKLYPDVEYLSIKVSPYTRVQDQVSNPSFKSFFLHL